MTSGDSTDSPEDYSVFIDRHFQSKLLALEDGFCTTAGYDAQKISPTISKQVVKNKQSKQTSKQQYDDVGIISGWWHEAPTQPRKRPGKEKEPRDSPKDCHSWRDGNNSYRTRHENFVFKHYTDIRKYIEQYRRDSILSRERPLSAGKGHHYTGTHNDAKRNFTKKDDQKGREEKMTTVLHYTHKRDAEVCSRHMADPSIQTHVYKLSNTAKGSGDYEVKTKSPNSSTFNQESKLNGTISVSPSTLPTFNNIPSLMVHRTKNDEVLTANSNVRTIDGLTSLAAPDKGQDVCTPTGVHQSDIFIYHPHPHHHDDYDHMTQKNASQEASSTADVTFFSKSREKQYLCKSVDMYDVLAGNAANNYTCILAENNFNELFPNSELNDRDSGITPIDNQFKVEEQSQNDSSKEISQSLTSHMQIEDSDSETDTCTSDLTACNRLCASNVDTYESNPELDDVEQTKPSCDNSSDNSKLNTQFYRWHPSQSENIKSDSRSRDMIVFRKANVSASILDVNALLQPTDGKGRPKGQNWLSKTRPLSSVASRAASSMDLHPHRRRMSRTLSPYLPINQHPKNFHLHRVELGFIGTSCLLADQDVPSTGTNKEVKVNKENYQHFIPKKNNLSARETFREEVIHRRRQEHLKKESENQLEKSIGKENKNMEFEHRWSDISHKASWNRVPLFRSKTDMFKPIGN